MIKSKKFMIAFLVLVLIPLFTLRIYASESDDLKTLQQNLRQAITAAEQIADALNEKKSVETVAGMIRNIEDIDTSVLGDTQDAPKTGTMVSGADSGDSVQAMFAKLQLELANAVKNDAVQQIDKVTAAQKEQQRASQYLEQARKLQTQAEAEPISLPGELQYYLEEKGLSYPAAESGYYTTDDFGKIISTLQSYSEKLGTDIQSQMVSVQDFMGQYNSYLQNANASIQNTAKSLDSVSRGQSLFSSEAGGVNAAPIAVSVLVGVLLGMLVMWLIIKKRMKKQSQEESV